MSTLPWVALCSLLATGCARTAPNVTSSSPSNDRDAETQQAVAKEASDGGVAEVVDANDPSVVDPKDPSVVGTTNPGAGDPAAVGDTGRSKPSSFPTKAPPVPIKVPARGPKGCVAPEQYRQYVEDLEAHAITSRDRAIAEQGAVLIQREGFLVGGPSGGYSDSEGPRLGEPYEVKGKRFVNVGYSETNTWAVLAQTGKTLHILESNARSNRITMKVCGVNPCIPGRGTMVESRPLIIALEPGESLGPSLVLRYDTWWVFPEYTATQRCQPVP